MTSNSLHQFSDKQLQDELKKREELAKQEQWRIRNENAVFWESKIDHILELVPKHSRTSCSDNNVFNEDRCTRCYLLCAKTSHWDSDRELTIYINKLKEL